MDGQPHLCEVAPRHDRRRLVVEPALEPGGAPVHELDRLLGLHARHSSVHVLGDDVTWGEGNRNLSREYKLPGCWGRRHLVQFGSRNVERCCETSLKAADLLKSLINWGSGKLERRSKTDLKDAAPIQSKVVNDEVGEGGTMGGRGPYLGT